MTFLDILDLSLNCYRTQTQLVLTNNQTLMANFKATKIKELFVKFDFVRGSNSIKLKNFAGINNFQFLFDGIVNSWNSLPSSILYSLNLKSFTTNLKFLDQS